MYQVLLGGVLMQWLTDPQTAPTAAELTASLRVIGGGLADG